MFYALDNNNKKVYSYYSSRDNVYLCPICNGKVTLKAGNFKVPHFAHVANECYDKWNYDMSEWHTSMQKYFDEEHREVVCRLGKNIHRADILKDGVVLEFQHSPISMVSHFSYTLLCILMV